MKKFTNYKYYTDNKKIVVATSTFAGKTVRGIAKCDEEDTFDLEVGKKIAAARCAAIVASKRAAFATKNLKTVLQRAKEAEQQLKKANSYWIDATEEEARTIAEVVNLMEEV